MSETVRPLESEAAIIDDIKSAVASFSIGGVYKYFRQLETFLNKQIFYLDIVDMPDRLAIGLLRQTEQYMRLFRITTLSKLTEVYSEYERR